MSNSTTSESAFLTHERLEGNCLARVISAGHMPIQDVLRYALDLAAILGQAHAQNIVHGDVRPERVILTSTGARLLDPEPPDARPAIHEYTAPEVAKGGSPEARSDIFSFGALLYEMASGWRPFHGETPEELRGAILNHAPPPLTVLTSALEFAPVYGELDRVVTSCLVKDPDKRRQRIQNAGIELKLVARALARQHGVVPRPALVVREAPPRPGRSIAGGPLQARDQAPPLAGREAAPAEPARVARTCVAPRPEAPAPAPPVAPDFKIFSPEKLPFPPPPPAEPGRAPKHPRKPAAPPVTRVRRFPFPLWLPLAAAIAVLCLLIWGVTAWLHRHPALPRVVKFDVTPPEHTSYPGMAAISPDGRYLTFSAVGPERQRLLWLRPLDAIHATTIAGTEGAFAPFWSPDGQEIGFFAGQSMKRVRVSGAAPAVLAPCETGAGGGAWNADGVIVFAPGMSGGLYKLRAAGGPAEPLTRLNEARRERAHLWPHFLPGGKHFLFFVLSDTTENTGVYTASLDGGEPVRLMVSETNAIYSAGGSGGYLIFVQNRAMTAQGFDASRRKLVGEPFILASEIGSVRSMGLAPVSVSENGILVYQTLGRPVRQLIWYDRAGRQLGTLAEPAEFGPPRISPDGQKVIIGKLAPRSTAADLWALDIATGGAVQITSTAESHEGSPVWSPDGHRVAYFRNAQGSFDLFVKPAVADLKSDLLFHSGEVKYPSDWSPDGKYVLFGSLGAGTQSDIWVAPAGGDQKAAPLLQTIYNEGYAVFSPDQKWIAFHSDQSGRVECYVQRFSLNDTVPARRWQISVGGGGLPKWRRDGREIFYITSGGKLMSAAVRTGGDQFSADPPKALFQTRPIPKEWNLFDVSPDGQRFLLNVPLEWSSSAPITVVTNWTDKLKR